MLLFFALSVNIKSLNPQNVLQTSDTTFNVKVEKWQCRIRDRKLKIKLHYLINFSKFEHLLFWNCADIGHNSLIDKGTKT